ncbi:hypothetical protein ACLOJK_029161 [Asimina triloba]
MESVRRSAVTALRRCLPRLSRRLPRHRHRRCIISLAAASFLSPALAAASFLSPALAAASFLSPALAAFPFPSSLPSFRCRRFFATASQIPTVPVPDSLSLAVTLALALALFPPSSASLSLPSFSSSRRPPLCPASAARFLTCLRTVRLRKRAPVTCSFSKTKVCILQYA